MATILAHIQVKPGSAASFEKIARALYVASTGKEAALRRYEYWRAKSPDSYYCLLAFDDYAGFLAHQASPHHEAAAAPLMDHIISLELEWLDPVQGASPLPATVPQHVGDTAGAVELAYAEQFPLVPASWWRDISKGAFA